MPELILPLLLGLVIGSFLNVVIGRLPAGESIVSPRSCCPHCRTPIAWYDNVPVLSFLLLRGRCRRCGERISLQYPLVEAVMGGLAVALYVRFPLPVALLYLPFVAALLAVAVIDLRHLIIPDRISLPGILAGMAVSFVNPLVSWQEAALGALLGGGVLWLVAWGYAALRGHEGMGGGDIKLLAMIGAWLGWPCLPFVVFASSVLGLVAGIGAMIQQRRGGKTMIPFGPFLVLGAYLYLFFRADVWYWLARLYA